MTVPVPGDTPDRHAETRAALRDPQVGDRFHEMYSWWMYVVAVTDETVITMQASAPCVFPTDAKRLDWTREGFISAQCYRSMPDTPLVTLADRGNDVSWWRHDA